MTTQPRMGDASRGSEGRLTSVCVEGPLARGPEQRALRMFPQMGERGSDGDGHRCWRGSRLQRPRGGRPGSARTVSRSLTPSSSSNSEHGNTCSRHTPRLARVWASQPPPCSGLRAGRERHVDPPSTENRVRAERLLHCVLGASWARWPTRTPPPRAGSRTQVGQTPRSECNRQQDRLSDMTWSLCGEAKGPTALETTARPASTTRRASTSTPDRSQTREQPRPS